MHSEEFHKRQNLNRTFVLLYFLGLILLIFRMMLRVDHYFMFLMWNLLLAYVPLAISFYLRFYPFSKPYRWLTVILSLLWLVFFPNAPYILTDYVHVIYGDKHIFVINLIVWLYFAVVAFWAALVSLTDLSRILLRYYNRYQLYMIVLAICVLAGYGIFLGRFMRFNTWDIFEHPKELFSSGIQMLIRYQFNLYSWFTVSSACMILYFAFLLKSMLGREQ